VVLVGLVHGGVMAQPPAPVPLYDAVPPPRTGSLWEPGHWHWNGERYVWIAGRWSSGGTRYGHWVLGRWGWDGDRWGRRPAHWE
jgi:hypothetical protein